MDWILDNPFAHVRYDWLPRADFCELFLSGSISGLALPFPAVQVSSQKIIMDSEETEASVIIISSGASSPEKVFTPTKR